MFTRLLPWEYGVRNLLRRPGRSLLTLLALATVNLLVLVVVGFLRGMEHSLSASGDPDVVIVHALGAGENLEYSSVANSTGDMLTSTASSLRRRYGTAYVSPELYLGAQLARGKDSPSSMGLVRGVTESAVLARRSVQLVEGRWPAAGEIVAGRLAAAKLGWPVESLRPGSSIWFEGRSWNVSGLFAARGAVFESEVWCRLDDLQQALKRQDLSVVAVTLADGATPAEIENLCKERRALELQATREADYYARLQRDYRPVRVLAWLLVGLVSMAGIFAGLNTMYGAVVGRVRELATLQTLGFLRRAIVVSLVQESLLLSLAGVLVSSLVAIALLNGLAVRFTMAAFTLRVDGVAILVGCGVGLLLGVGGAIPPAIRAMRSSVAESLKAV